ncbi:ras-related protein Rap-1b isoform X2 [Cherax quadricarinatus]|uniref:ras-related protein Rap-1b isoform X2 n=1 Tax=Cherax quadricarinatus TaxID=27406 RepID=UPI00237874AD|nr:ras-related protein Rap-1b-like [Cherax quadricarinatus]
MELCGGCFSPHPSTVSEMMKARHFGRRFSLQASPVSTEDSARGSSAGRRGAAAAGVAAAGAAAGGNQSVGTACEREEQQDDQQRRYKVVIMGAAKVGKTAIINQFLYDTFTSKYTRTVEEMHHGEYEVSGISLTLDILDTSGSYEFPAMRELSVNTADAFILVYSITDAASFEEVRHLREFILQTKKEAVPIVVVGNKADLEDQRVVPLETAETTVLVKWENGFLESSAKDNLNVLHIFKELLNQAKIRYALSPAVKRRRQSMPNVGLQITPAQLSHLRHIKQKSSGKRNSCSIS